MDIMDRMAEFGENHHLRILLIDEDENDYNQIRNYLTESQGVKFTLNWIADVRTGAAALLDSDFDVAMIDYHTHEKTGLEIAREAVSRGCRSPIILLTATSEKSIDVAAMRAGAADYLVKSQLNSHLLERSIRYSIFRNRTLAELREREESFRGLFDATFEGIIVHDGDGEVLDANRSAAQIFGFPPADLLGIKIDKLISVRTSGMLEEVFGTRSDGTHFPAEITTKEYFYRGDATRLVAIRDITNRKHMEAQILAQDRLASVGLLASSLAHEIGTPLGVIRGRAEYLTLRERNYDTIKSTADIIVTQIDRVSKLIRTLLNLARGENELAGQKIFIGPLIDEAAELLAHEFRKNQIAFSNEYSEKSSGGPLSEGSAAVLAEREQFHQVLLNLLVNSIHAIGTAIAAGRTTGHFIHVRKILTDNQWVIRIEDSGCGISRENMRNLFKPFFTTKDVGRGTGLGLTTCYKIVYGWSGSIVVESEEGVGATFQVLLPKA